MDLWYGIHALIFSLELDLFGAIVPVECAAKALSTKIEIKLKKLEPIRWPSLEGVGVPVVVPLPRMVAAGELSSVE